MPSAYNNMGLLVFRLLGFLWHHRIGIAIVMAVVGKMTFALFPNEADEITQKIAHRVLSSNVISNDEANEKLEELSSIGFSEFNERSNVEEFDIATDKVESFVQEYFTVLKIDETTMNKALLFVKHVMEGGLSHENVHRFTIEGGGRYTVYYLVLNRKNYDTTFLYLMYSDFTFLFSPKLQKESIITKDEGWIYTTEKKQIVIKERPRDLTLEQKKSMEDLFLHKSKQNFCRMMSLDCEQEDENAREEDANSKKKTRALN